MYATVPTAVPGLVELLRSCRYRRNNLIRIGRTDLRQAEVEDLGVSAFGDEYVCGLDVAVNDPLACAASRASAISIASETAISLSNGLPAIR